MGAVGADISCGSLQITYISLHSLLDLNQLVLAPLDPLDPCLWRAGVFDLVGQILHAAIAETNVLAKDARRFNE